MAEPLPAWAQKRHSDAVRKNQSRSFAVDYQEVHERILALEEAMTELIGELSRDKTLSERLKGWLSKNS